MEQMGFRYRYACKGARLPEGWEWAGLLRPTEELGGDVCMVHHRPPWAYLMVADIAGKGRKPARWSSQLREVFMRAAARHTEAGGLLREIRAALGPRLADEDTFITLALLVVNLEEGTYTYANAGHSASYLLREAGPQAERLSATELPLGVLGSPEKSRVYQGTFRPGDVLWLYSDGATEVSDRRGHIFGRSGLLDVFLAARAGPLPEQLRAVCKALGLHRGARPLPDDLTLLGFRRRPVQPALAGFPFVIQARYLHVRAATQRLVRQQRFWARRFGLPLEDTFFFHWELAISEVLTNIVQHAYNHQPDRIQGMLLLYPEAMVLDVWDAGAPFEGDLAKYLHRPEPFPREKGYGLYLIHQSVDRVQYRRVLERNWWRLLKYIVHPIHEVAT